MFLLASGFATDGGSSALPLVMLVMGIFWNVVEELEAAISSKISGLVWMLDTVKMSRINCTSKAFL